MNMESVVGGDYEAVGKILEEHEKKDQQVTVEVISQMKANIRLCRFKLKFNGFAR